MARRLLPGAAERVLTRRRLRRQRRLREALLLDLGALVYELHRQGKRAPELLQEKAGELTLIDEEVRGLEEALGDGAGLEGLIATGIVGSCASCGGLLNAGDAYCARCGAAAEVRAAGATEDAEAGATEDAEAGPTEHAEAGATEDAEVETGEFAAGAVADVAERDGEDPRA